MDPVVDASAQVQAHLDRIVQDLAQYERLAEDPTYPLEKIKETLAVLFKKEATLQPLLQGAYSHQVSVVMAKLSATGTRLVELASSRLSPSTAYTKSEIPPNEIFYDEVRDLRGKGAFARVFKATCRGKIVACKVPTVQMLTEGQIALFRHEIEIYRSITSPNVVQFHGACTEPGHLFIVTELMAGNLENFMLSPDFQKVSFYERLCMALDIALGMNWLHGICHIIHRDLKPANLLLDNIVYVAPANVLSETHRRVKISDFGFSQVVPQGKQLVDRAGAKGSWLYMAPEVMCLEQFDNKSDVYSFGIILWELLTGMEPYAEAGDDVNALYTIVCINRQRPPVDMLPASIARLLTNCWNHYAQLRPTFEVIKDAIEDAIIDAALHQEAPHGSVMFWRRFFSRPLKTSVEAKDFQLALASAVPGHVYNSGMDSILCGSDAEISLKRFRYLCLWFGPFFEPEQGAHLISEIVSLAAQPWFHCDIFDSSLAEKRLKNRQTGTFIIRPSFNNEAGSRPFTLSYLDSSSPAPIHVRISRLTFDVNAPERYALGEERQYRARSLPELVSRIRMLQHPCPRQILTGYSNIQDGYSSRAPK
eukprot:m51a1_g7204 putative sh2 domain-containing protein (592) ;mRNA; f:215233-217722